MTELLSDVLRVLDERGFIHQCSDLAGLDERAREGPIAGYIGFDCTAPSLHVGSLVQIMTLRWLQKTGNKPIVLIGGGTTKVGDPSGQDEQRQLLSDQAIATNKAGIRRVFDRFITFGDRPSDAILVDNAEWLDELAYIPFLRDYGRHFSVNRMLRSDSVRLRLEREHPLSFLEFNYMVLQAYDFLELAKRYACLLQLGGSDQWGNIVNGIELARRVDERTLYGLTTPLITTASGQKMGKTAQGAVWLAPDLVSPYEYYQYWRNAEDADVGRFLKLFTELPLDEIVRLEALEGAELNEAKKRLAFEATKLCHGEREARTAAETAAAVFERGGIGTLIIEMEAGKFTLTGFPPVVEITRTGLPVVEIARAELDDGVAAFELFRRSGLRPTGAQARKLIRDRGARINDEIVTSETRPVTAADLNRDGVIKLSAGRKRHALVRPV